MTMEAAGAAGAAAATGATDAPESAEHVETAVEPDALEAIEFADNPDPRCACVLLLDTSGSMAGEPIVALNEGLKAFERDIKEDRLAARRVEIAVITFGGSVNLQQDFVPAAQFEAPALSCSGSTPMGAAISDGIARLRERKALYQRQGIAYYRPWLFMVTDGQPTDAWEEAAAAVRAEEERNGLAFFAVGVQSADMETLGRIAVRTPVRLRGLAFVEMFVWLSRSQKRVSASRPGEQTRLETIEGWGAV